MPNNITSEFPKFIDDYPLGNDQLEDKPQEKIANDILDFFSKNPDKKRRVIGLDGEWGAGKSNIIEIIKKKAESNYYVFTFDAWGHQEDLTRRSFLEELVEDAIDNKKLSNNWTDKLEKDLATNIYTNTRDVPQLNKRAIIFLFILLGFNLIKDIITWILTKAELT